MTRVYQNPAPPPAGSAQTRVLIIGAGRYPFAQSETARKPKLKHLESVGPSIRTFLTKLLCDWSSDLCAPLATIDLLLSESDSPDGSVWPGLSVPGEVATGTRIDEPTLPKVNEALNASLDGATVDDHFLFLCCGHGFWKTQSFFILSDFGSNERNPWDAVIDLDGFRIGLAQEKPRYQWLFFDCCKDIPDAVLRTLSNIGTPLIETNAEEIAKANKLGALSQFGLSSAAIGERAFGIPGKPSRFFEMLIDALGGAGAVSRSDGKWWINDRGITDAVRSYALRHPELTDPEFYKTAMPISNDMPGRLSFRSVVNAPKSRLVVFSSPRTAMRDAELVVLCDGSGFGGASLQVAPKS
jgi:hypothetical protein